MRALRPALFATGLTAAAAQIVLIRELLVVFNGNEMSLGAMLAAWLLWTAAGSAIGGRWKRADLPLLQCVQAAAFPLAIVAARASRLVFARVPGEVLGPAPMLAASVAALGAFCLVSGALFSAGVRQWAALENSSAPDAAAPVYLLESLGAAAGGVLASLLLVSRLEPFAIAAVAAVLDLAAAFLLRPRWKYALAVAALAALFLPAAETRTRGWLWRGLPVTASRDTIYGNLTLVSSEGSRTLYQNGLPLVTVPDPEAAEEAVHYALLQHPAPRRVLLIGGGNNGSAAEVLKHPGIESLDYAELDPAVLAMLPDLPSDPRLHIHNIDGRLFLERSPGGYDAIILNLPDPQTAQINRFYTLEFFRLVASKMNSGGVFSFGVTGAEDYVSPELAASLRSMNATLRGAFPNVTVLGGGTVHFFASRRELIRGGDEWLARLSARGIQTVYVREYFLPFRMPRTEALLRQIEPGPATPVNRDFRPIGYLLSVEAWSRRFHAGSSLPRPAFGVVLGVALAALALVAVTARGGGRGVAAASTAAMGFAMMGLEIMLLLEFQALHGYVYERLALLVACFMGGMAAGSRLGARAAPSARNLALTGLAASIAPFAVFGLRAWFPLLAALSGAIGGFQFPIASRLFRARNAGALYALDLAGSCAGALLLAGFLIPAYGMLRSAALMSALTAAPAIFALRKPAR
jgi:spermidine synthase